MYIDVMDQSIERKVIMNKYAMVNISIKYTGIQVIKILKYNFR